MFKKLSQKIQYAAFSIPAYAVDTVKLTPDAEGNFSGLTTITVEKLITGAVSLVLIVVALVFFFILIFGGVRWIMSSGDEKAVAAARSQITNALIGLAIVFAAYAIMNLMSTLFGVKLLDGFMINPL